MDHSSPAEGSDTFARASFPNAPPRAAARRASSRSGAERSRESRLGLLLLVTVVVALLATSVWAAANLDLSKSNVNRLLARGSLVTASTDVTSGAARTVYNTPDSSDFILTQVCAGSAGILLQVGGASLVQVGSGLCQSFSPGMLLTPGQPVTCSALGGDTTTFCTIAGILGYAPPTPSPALLRR
jgi:hypothetical protein